MYVACVDIITAAAHSNCVSSVKFISHICSLLTSLHVSSLSPLPFLPLPLASPPSPPLPLLPLPPHIQSLDRSVLDDIMEDLDALLSDTVKDFDSDQVGEMFQLDLALRLLECPYNNKVHLTFHISHFTFHINEICIYINGHEWLI